MTRPPLDKSAARHVNSLLFPADIMAGMNPVQLKSVKDFAKTIKYWTSDFLEKESQKDLQAEADDTASILKSLLESMHKVMPESDPFYVAVSKLHQKFEEFDYTTKAATLGKAYKECSETLLKFHASCQSAAPAEPGRKPE